MSTDVSDVEGAVVPVYIIDELRLKPGCLEAFLAAMRDRYLPGATGRGQRLLHTLVTPPTSTGAGSGLVPQSVILIWHLGGVAGFWGVRSQNATAEVAEWWVECEAFMESRTRRVAAESDSIAGLDALGRINA